MNPDGSDVRPGSSIPSLTTVIFRRTERRCFTTKDRRTRTFIWPMSMARTSVSCLSSPALWLVSRFQTVRIPGDEP
jgi:hypothetical protein